MFWNKVNVFLLVEGYYLYKFDIFPNTITHTLSELPIPKQTLELLEAFITLEIMCWDL